MNATLITSPVSPLTQETALARLRVRAAEATASNDPDRQVYGGHLSIILNCLDSLRVHGTKSTIRELWRTARMLAERLDAHDSIVTL